MKKLALLPLLLIASCGRESATSTAPASNGKPQVLVANYPLKYFAERIGGSTVEVVFPAPGDEDPAFWQPDDAAIAKFQSADVILMSMGEEDRSNVTEAMTYRRPVRKDQINPRLVLLREEDAAVDDEKFASMLDCGHIAADLSESAESDESHATVDKFRWCSEIGMRMVHEI